jgi:hypothetical protein
MSAKEEREAYNGRAMIAAFREYCNQKGASPTEDRLKSWDERHNHSRIRKSFGTSQEVMRKALRMLYRKYLDRYSAVFLRIPKDKHIFKMQEIRPDGQGGRRFIPDLTEEGLRFNQNKIEREIRDAVLRAKFFKLSIYKIRSIVETALRSEAA